MVAGPAGTFRPVEPGRVGPAPPPTERVGELLAAVAAGTPPPFDLRTEVVPQPPGPVAGVLAFAGHHVVAADVDPAWVHERLPEADLSAPVGGHFVAALSDHLGRAGDNIDAVFVTHGEPGPPPIELVPATAEDHPRLARADRYRRDVVAWETPDRDGLVLLGRGLALRWEVAFEVRDAARGAGLGRRLVAAARHLVPVGAPVWVQVAPGNVPSLRAVLAAGGFVPVGAEILFPDP